MERESDPEKDRRDRSGQASTSRPLGEQRCCIGLTYFSQALHEQGKMPKCVGLRDKPGNREMTHPSEEVTSVPGGDFKYVCVGYAVYDEEKLQQQRHEAKKSPTAPVELPYCEGLEVISAAQLQQSPAVLDAPAGAAAAASPQSRPLDEGPARKPRTLRGSTFPGRMPGENLGDVSVREFLERAMKTGGKIVNKMGANAQLVLDTVKSAIEEGRKGR